MKIFVVEDEPKTAAARPRGAIPARGAVDFPRPSSLMPIHAVIVINMFPGGTLFGFLPVYLHGLGQSATESGTVVSITTAAHLLIQRVAGALADRYAMRTTVLLGLFVAVSVMVTTFASGWILIAIVIAAGMGIGSRPTRAPEAAEIARSCPCLDLQNGYMEIRVIEGARPDAR